MKIGTDSARWTPLPGDLRDLAPAAFALLGNNVVAYLKPVIADNKPGLEVHAADGSTLALIHGDWDVALAIIRQNDLEPVSLH